MKKLRLILWKECDRCCSGCCNNDWNLDALPIVNDFTRYSMVLLTGGEPMLRPLQLESVINNVHTQNAAAKIILYTAKPDWTLAWLLRKLDGVTVTLHEQDDVHNFARFLTILHDEHVEGKSLRLNVFRGIDISSLCLTGWIVKSDMTWIKDCPLPEGEVLGRSIKY